VHSVCAEERAAQRQDAKVYVKAVCGATVCGASMCTTEHRGTTRSPPDGAKGRNQCVCRGWRVRPPCNSWLGPMGASGSRAHLGLAWDARCLVRFLGTAQPAYFYRLSGIQLHSM